jgi:hypothetical protein
MTPEQQQIAIGETDGWTWHGDASWPKHPSNHYWKKGRLNYQILPKYLNDLNAMHELESILNADQMVSYDYHLDCVVGNGRQGLNIEYFLWSATAAQRAEAFLRTIGKWEEAK